MAISSAELNAHINAAITNNAASPADDKSKSEKEKLDKDSNPGPIPKGWILVSGDIKKLTDPASQEKVIYRRVVPEANPVSPTTAATAVAAATGATMPTTVTTTVAVATATTATATGSQNSAANTASADTKLDKDNKIAKEKKKNLGAEFQEIIISRVEEERFGINHKMGDPKIKTGFRPISLSLTKISEELCVCTGFPSYLFTKFKDKIPVSDDQDDLLPAVNDIWALQLNWNVPLSEASHAFLIGAMPEYMKKLYFYLLVETTYLTQEEADYFSKLCPSKEISAVERSLREEIDAILNTKNSANYNRCIEIARILHLISSTEGKNNQRVITNVFDSENNPTINHVFFDEQDIAYILGLKFKKLSYHHAIEAFSIIGKGSPLYKAAQEHILNLQIALSDIYADKSNLGTSKDTVETRSLRASAISKVKALESAENNILFYNLLDAHCGYNPLGPDRLFNNRNYVKLDQEHGIREKSDFLLQPLFTMADDLYEKNKLAPISTLQCLTALQVNDGKQKSEIGILQKSKDSASSAATGSTGNTVAATAVSISIVSEISSVPINIENSASAKSSVAVSGDTRKIILGDANKKDAAEKNAQLSVPPDWTWVSGELENLRDNDSKEILIFKRNEFVTAADQGYFEPVEANSNAAQDAKNAKENSQFKVTEIKIARTKLLGHYQYQSQNAKQTQYRPVTIILYFSNCKEPNTINYNLHPHLPFEFPPSLLGAAKLSAGNPVEFYHAPFLEFTPTGQLPHLFKQIELLPKYIREVWSDFLMKKGVWTKKEAAFFMDLCPEPKISEKEQRLRGLIREHIDAKRYDEVVKLAKDIHSMTLKRNEENDLVLIERLNDDGTFKSPDYLDTDDFCYNLGKEVFEHSPYSAYDIFDIITENSPLYREAQENMTKLAIKFAFIEAKEKHDIDASRAWYKKAIIHHFRGSKVKDLNRRLFFSILLQYAGFSQTEGEKMVSSLATEKLEDNNNSWIFLVKIMLVLAEKIYCLNNPEYQMAQQIALIASASNSSNAPEEMEVNASKANASQPNKVVLLSSAAVQLSQIQVATANAPSSNASLDSSASATGISTAVSSPAKK